MSARGPAPARERILAAASELFYREGVHTVGVDRIIEHAAVAKATLYSSFGSKDELIAAYLRARHLEMKERVERAIARRRSPRARLLAPFDVQIELGGEPGYRGCAFANATAEAHAASADVVSRDYRRWLRGVFAELAREAGVPEPDRLACQLHLLWDGAAQAARMDDDIAPARAARAAAEALLSQAI